MVSDEHPVSAEVVIRLQRDVRVLRAAVFALAALSAVGVLAGFAARDDDVLRVRGIVVEDARGKPRILLGAPIPAVEERQRKDAASGLVLLDAAGVDRLQIGEVGGPQMGGKLQPRIADATGLMVCDAQGDERAGFGYLANGQVGWGLDYESGEAIVAAILPERGVAGIVINAESEDGVSPRAILMTGADGVGLRLSDGEGRERAVLEVGGLGAPALQVLDASGALVRDVLSGAK
jgi:hypothetical protein